MVQKKIVVNNDYICLTCNENTPSLYKSNSGHFIKLVECMKCGNIVDHYIECEKSVIITDLVMQESAAFKHILYNSNDFSSQFYSKLTLCIILLEGYIRWINFDGGGESSTSQDKSIKNNEFSFYKLCIVAFLELFMLFCTIYVTYASIGIRRPLSRSVKAIVIGQGGRLLRIAPIIYAEGLSVPFDIFMLVFLYSSTVQSVRATFLEHRVIATVTVGIALMTSRFASNAVEFIIM